MMKGLSILQERIMAYMREHHPNDWVVIGGTNLQVAKGLARQGLVQIRLTPRRVHQMRLSPSLDAEAEPD